MMAKSLFYLLTLSFIIFSHLFIIVNSLHSSENENKHLVPIKVVRELTNFDSPGFPEIESNLSRVRKKIKNVIPSPFSGPEQFQRLVGLCFSYLDEKYKYRFCPFSNVTQDEVQVLQETYRGILGVWGEWYVEENQFTAFHFIEGSRCGSGTARSVKINVACSFVSRLANINEPSRCQYEGLFETPLACGKNSMLVYPRLPKELQLKWDVIETEKHNGILTQKGYDEQLDQLFLEAGYFLSPERKRELGQQLNEEDSECEESRKLLLKRLKELEEAIQEKDHLIQNLTQQLNKRS